MKILFVISEVAGYAKTGGLADVGKALPLALKRQGHDVRVVMPYYKTVAKHTHSTMRIASLGVPMGGTEEWCSVRETLLEGVPIYLMEHHRFFSRERLYDDGEWEYGDNAERFGFFSKAALQLCLALQFTPDILNCNDWPTSLVPFYAKVHYAHTPYFQKTASILTIHNGGYQGKYSGEKASYLGIAPEYFRWDTFEDWGSLNLLKGGIAYADKINAVSPGYAQELLSSGGSHGLYASFDRRRADVLGILNGVEYEQWKTQNNPYLPASYHVEDLRGKAICKAELQRAFNLPIDPHVPVIGVVSRLTEQKGFTYSIPAIHNILGWRVQLVFLGAGESWIEQYLNSLAQTHPQKVGTLIGYSEKLAHWIEAGSDLFLMPSLYEPCGLNQIYSLRYGTLPIVREVGGLKDTVQPYQEATGEGTGFMFGPPDPNALTDCIGVAVSTYYDRPQHFQAMIQRAMLQNFDWESAAHGYEAMYQSALAKYNV